MLKRKVLAGGYQDSSDDESSLDGLKRTKAVPYAPPRLTATSRSGSSTFQLPGSSGSWPRISVPQSRQVSVSSSSGRPTPVPESEQSVRNTPEIQIGAGPEPLSRGSTIEPTGAVTLRASKALVKSSSTPSDAYRPSNTRSSLTMERQINELTGTFEEYKHISEERQKATDSTLTLILETLNRLESTKNTTAETPSNLPLMLSNLADVRLLNSNPVPTPELIAIISKVVTEARSRVGKKKGGAEDNSCKEHARTTFYRMLGITAAREVRPYFEDEYGEPDTLPMQFVDPDTGYCRPYPHWKAPLTKQAAWVPTFILRFKSTIPNGQSELSNVLRGLSDEAITILLHDGPFKSATTAWRDSKKSDTEVESMRSNARRYQRCDRKAALRGGYIKTIPALQGSDWEYLFQPGYMSQDESDDEGALVTKRSESRAQWENNLFDAISVAERLKARSKSGFPLRLPRRSVELVKRPIPHLERGTGSGKFTIRIAICGVSNTWRQQHPDELRKQTHLFNMRATAKPDISLFLEQNPLSAIDGTDSNEEGEGNRHSVELDCAAVKLEGNPSGEGGAIVVGSDDANHVAVWPGLNYDGEEESGAILDMDESFPGFHTINVIDRPEAQELMEGDISGSADFVIDPQLIAEDTGGKKEQSGTLPDIPKAGIPPPFYNSEMPPPPLLNTDPNSARSQAATSDDPPAKGKAKKTPVKKSGTVVTITEKPEEGDSSLSVVAQPKRRGRPPGSKNKPKTY